ncbi:MAG: HesA/MoeB/ThiF family protein [Candidatus Woesearchaeota archaeon]
MSTRKVLGKKVETLKDKTIAIIGLGGLGCTTANLLARLKINLIIVDNDIVDDTNLERQILYDKSDLLKSKVNAAEEKLSQFTKIISINKELNDKNIKDIIPNNIDLIIDCTDNIAVRKNINNYCIKNKINWIYSGAVSNIGAIYFIDNKNNGPCYECLQQNKDGETSCEIGVLNSLVVMVSSLTVNIAVNYLVNNKIEDKLLRINLNNNSIMKFNVKKHNNCRACNKKYN